MPEFKLKPEPDTRTEGGMFLVHRTDTDQSVGRVLDMGKVMPPDAANTWFWCLIFPHYTGSDAPWYGNVESIDAAKAAFKARWLLSHPE